MCGKQFLANMESRTQIEGHQESIQKLGTDFKEKKQKRLDCTMQFMEEKETSRGFNRQLAEMKRGIGEFGFQEQLDMRKNQFWELEQLHKIKKGKDAKY